MQRIPEYLLPSILNVTSCITTVWLPNQEIHTDAILLTILQNSDFASYPTHKKVLFSNPVFYLITFPWVQFSSVAQSCPTLCDSMNHSMPSLPVHHQLPESTQTYVHWVSDAIQPSRPLLSPFPPALNLSWHQGLFKWVSSLHQVAQLLGFRFSISPSNELISFRMDWLDLLAVQGTLKSLLQHHSSKPSILQCSAFFIVSNKNEQPS